MAELPGQLIKKLCALPRYTDPFQTFWEQAGSQPLTYRLLSAYRPLLDDCTARRVEEARRRTEVIRRCQTIQPVPLPHLPLGF